MEVLKTKRRLIKARVTRTQTFLNTLLDSTTIESLEVRLLKLDEAWHDYHDNMNTMIMCHEEGAPELDVETDIIDFETNYFKAKGTLCQEIAKRKHLSNTPQVGTLNSDSVTGLMDQQASFLEKFSKVVMPGIKHEQLPKIKIPSFSGNYCEWKSFHDMFLSSVHHNTSLTSCDKFHYLKSFLKDEPLALLRHISITDNNYKEAWEKLISRYDRDSYITNSFIKSYLSIPSLTQPNDKLLRNLHDTADEVVRGLRALGSDAESRDPWLMYILFNKLDPQSKQAWADICDTDYPSLQTFLNFLDKRCQSLESLHSSTRPSTKPQRITNSASNFHITTVACPMCAAEHNLFQCPNFISSSIEERRAFVNTHRLCFNCLRPNHNASSCRSLHRCRINNCKSRHHSLVHSPMPLEQRQYQSTSSNAPSRRNLELIHSPSNSHSNSNRSPNHASPSSSTRPQATSHVGQFELNSSYRPVHTLIPTALVEVEDVRGVLHKVRILLDSGSQLSFVTESCVKRLGISRSYANLVINGISSSKAGATRGLVNLTLKSRHNPNSINIRAYILKVISSDLPNTACQALDCIELQSLELADPNYATPAPIDILIGSDYLFDIVTGKPIPINSSSIKALDTIFGCVVGGNLYTPLSLNTQHMSFNTTVGLEFSLQRFWETEECNQMTVPLTEEEQQAESNFSSTYRRDSQGRFVVELPFKTKSPIKFENTLVSATKLLLSLERRFCVNKSLQESYIKFMREYIALGHMTEISKGQLDRNAYYIPHHAIFKPDSSTTKVRVVFDASALDSSGQSLNQHLLIGPPIQRDLFAICIRFRRHRFVFSADVEKMFRQIWIAEKHLDFQRILWREASDQPIRHYHLRTVTYGTSSAPFLSNRALLQIGFDYEQLLPTAANAILRDFYVDDIMSGADTVEEIIQLRKDIVHILNSAGFHLRKWCTNCWPLLMEIPEEEREVQPFDFDQDKSVKVLGLHWFPQNDSFSYKINLGAVGKISKRQILSDASKIYDPLGFLAPSIVLIKILFQELWLNKADWDDILAEDISARWLAIRNELFFFKDQLVARCMGNLDKGELVAFCDASEMAYAAVIYARTLSDDGKYVVTLLAAKTKVAPLKTVSLPRLELCGALLLCRLYDRIRTSLNIPHVAITAYTDSQIVLSWLSSTPRRWKTYISNRTSEILGSISRDRWKHIRSADNIADCASRGLMPSTLLSYDHWWKGPHWLREGNSYLSNATQIEAEVEAIMTEERSSFKSHTTSIEDHFLENLSEKVSSWNKLIRVIAYVRRFIQVVRRQHSTSSTLIADEITQAKSICIRYAQQLSFCSELLRLRNGQPVSKRSKLSPLYPYLDENDVVRVGGRINPAMIANSAKHPIILEHSSRITALIIKDAHTLYLHAGVSALFVILRQKYWIFGCRNALRKLVRQCVTCFKNRKSSYYQLMGELPPERIRYAPPFEITGVDYAGPLIIRSCRGRYPKFVKGYIAIFVCFTTKAIHIELVQELSSDAFIAALRRFISRRGLCRQIFSDNGTNFHGAKRILSEMYKHVYSNTHNQLVQDALAKDEISWKFIPPSAPHFGGLWESAVRSVKLHLKRVIGEAKLTYVELYTLLVQIESILNSRPLFAASDTDLDVITPAHFLIGRPLTALPESEIVPAQTVHSNWQVLQRLMQSFWVRWHTEYLTSLQQRNKWRSPQPQIRENMIVLLKEPKLPPSKWILGQVVKCHPGHDGLTRVVTIRTHSGTYDRPVTKIAPLPFSEEPEILQRGEYVREPSTAET